MVTTWPAADTVVLGSYVVSEIVMELTPTPWLVYEPIPRFNIAIIKQ